MNTRQRTLVIISLAVVATFTAVTIAPSAARANQKKAAAVAQPDFKAQQIKRGAYLVTIGGCDDCHTPWKMGPQGPEPDMTRRLSGHPESMKLGAAPKPEGGWMWAGAATNTAFAGPWGVSYARNLTPERLTGTGIWNEEIFIKTIRTGRHWGVSRPILPPMPWQNYRQATDEDLKAIFAFLQSLPPVKNEVPEPVIAPPPGA